MEWAGCYWCVREGTFSHKKKAISDIPNIKLFIKSARYCNCAHFYLYGFATRFKQDFHLPKTVQTTRRKINLCSDELNRGPFSHRLIFDWIPSINSNYWLNSCWEIRIDPKNIHFIGQMDLTSTEFKVLTHKCAYLYLSDIWRYSTWMCLGSHAMWSYAL